MGELRKNPQMSISRPYPLDDLLETVTQMRAELLEAGMVWAQFEETDGFLVARGWETGPNGETEQPI
jgi:hypothetical protein